MLVDLRDLRWTVIASQHRSLRQAAHALNVRQSTLSRRLTQIEISLGAQLFVRTNGGTHLTVAGEEFCANASNILQAVDTASRRLKTRSRGENGLLKIGIYASPSTGNMFATLLDHHRSFPEVEVRTVDGSHDQLLCALTNNAIDIAIMTDRPSGWGDRILPLWSERLIVAIDIRHRLSKLEVVHWPELAGETILIPESGPGPELERLFISKLGNYGAQRVVHQESSLDRLLSLVAVGYGALLMLEGATGVRHENVTYREVRDEGGPTRLNFAAYWREDNRNPTLMPFLALLSQRYPDLAGTAPTETPLVGGAP
jgi:DNA-binding transcriptional LysR family regulator